MSIDVRRVTTLAIVFLAAIPITAAIVPGERKLLVRSHAEHRELPVDVEREPGVRRLAVYPAMHAIAVPEKAVERVIALLAGGEFDIEELEDVIRTPRRTIASRISAPSAPYAAGLFVLQYVAPPIPAWQAAVRQTGARVVDSLPERSIIVTATAEQITELAKLPWIQYAGPYLAEYKHAPVASESHTTFMLQLVDTSASANAVTKIRERVGGFLAETRRGAELIAYFHSDLATAKSLLDEPFVVAVEAYIPPQPSDERQALGLTGVTTLTSSMNYLGWLSARGITPTALTNSGIVVDIADTGIDYGCYNGLSQHPDLKGRVVYHNGTTGSASSFPYSDSSGHGTIIATIAGGNPTVGIDSAGAATNGYGYRDNDNGQFYWGLGVAPGIRLGSTKILSAQTGAVGTVAEWTRRAVTQNCNTPANVCTPTANLCAATVQNHSHNEYDSAGTNAGAYTLNAREFDFAVRDADNLSAGLTPLTITMAAGNYGQNTTDTTKQVMAAATAKNVISMGGVESVRTTPPVCTTDTIAGVNPELRHLGQGYDVLAFLSRRGTIDNRVKPDLLAPATLSLGARTRNISSTTAVCTTGGNSAASYYPHYRGSSGTSYAAPAAAGAVALLRYHYNASLSPAMYKAMLVAGGRSITGKLDRLETMLQGTTRTVTKWPSAPQGFGVINLADLLNTSVVKSWRDQQTILLNGQTTTYTVTVTDPSKPMRIALAWTDAPAAAGAPVALVNDLDLRANGATFRVYGNITGADDFSLVNPGCGRPSCSFYDNRNNVEVLNIPTSVFSDPANRTFTVTVFAAIVNGIGVPGASGGTNNQDYALFALNGTIQ